MALTTDTPTFLASPDLRPREGDLFNIDAALTEEERAIRDSVRAFVDEKVLPIIGSCYVDGRFPKELIAEMGANGYFGANLPEEYGCAGLSNVAYGLIMQELERGDSGIRSFASVQGALVMYPIYAFGSEAQKRHYLPKMATGEIIGCFGLTEPDYGSNPAGMITRELVFDNVHLPADAILPNSGGLKSPLMCLTQARYGISWGALGAAIACYEEALSYSKERVMFGRPIGGFQIQQVRLADMLTELVKGQLVSLHLGRMKDAGTFTPQQVSFAKRNNVNIATDIAREARRLLGGNGIMAEYASMRHMANLESVYTYEGTHDIHSLILGQAVTGMNAFGG